jgi:hypothetical protein
VLVRKNVELRHAETITFDDLMDFAKQHRVDQRQKHAQATDHLKDGRGSQPREPDQEEEEARPGVVGNRCEPPVSAGRSHHSDTE